MNICECGKCGQECKNRFVSGHNTRVHNPSKKGRIAWNKGLTKETDSRMMSTSKTLMGHPVSEKTRKSVSVAQTGIIWNEERKRNHSLSLIGRKVSVYTRNLIREANKISQKEKWKDPEFHKKMCVIRKETWTDENFKRLQLEKMMGGSENRPTKPEKQLISLFENLSLPFEYTGDCSFFVGNINPDFIDHIRKVVIEFQGCYWHGCKECSPDSKMENTFPRRRIIFKKYGHSSIEIWEHELKDIDVLSKKLLVFQMCNILKLVQI